MPFTIQYILTLKIWRWRVWGFFCLKREATVKLLPLARYGAKFKIMRACL